MNLFASKQGILFLQEKNVWKKFNLCGDLVDKNTYDFLITAHFNQTGYIKTRQNGVEKLISDLNEMTCSYYDKSGNTVLVEKIPG